MVEQVPYARFIEDLHDGQRCSLCCELLGDGESVVETEGQVVYGHIPGQIGMKLRVRYHLDCLFLEEQH